MIQQLQTQRVTFIESNQWRTEGVDGVWGGSNPPPEIPKALQNRSKLNPIVKTVKICRS